jgi:hypothetical protein
MKYLRDTYRPGNDRLVYVAVGKSPVSIVARIYGPHHRKESPDATTVELEPLEPKIFVMDFEFRKLGNYIFVIEEDGEVEAILNAKVYA